MRTASTTSKSKSTTSTRSSHYTYVYCAVRGVPSAASVTGLPTMPGGGAPRVLSLTPGISLIVADVPADTYASDAIEPRLSDLDWVALCGTAHHAVADEIVQSHSVVPFRLFTLFSSDASAVATLGRRAGAIDAALERVAGKGEWVLKIAKSDRGARGARGAGGAVRGAGAAGAPVAQMSGTSFLQKKAAAKQAAAATAKRVIDDSARAYEALAALAVEAKFRDVEAGAGLLLDASFLLSSADVERAKSALTGAAERLLEDGCRVSLTGPWPPYSFVSLESASDRG